MAFGSTLVPRSPLAINLELCHGRHGACARVEIEEHGGGPTARLALRGWIEDVALSRLDRVLVDLAERGVRRLVLDCSQLRHVEYRLIPALAEALLPFDQPPGGCALSGLSRHLRDLFCLAGGAAGRLGQTRDEESPAWSEPGREWAS